MGEIAILMVHSIQSLNTFYKSFWGVMLIYIHIKEIYFKKNKAPDATLIGR